MFAGFIMSLNQCEVYAFEDRYVNEEEDGKEFVVGLVFGRRATMLRLVIKTMVTVQIGPWAIRCEMPFSMVS